MKIIEDRKYALIMLVLSMIYSISAYNLDADFDPTHEKFYAFALGVCMVLLSMALLIRPTQQKVIWPNLKNLQKIGITICTILVYSLALHKVGFLICASVLMGACMWVFNAKTKFIIPVSITVAITFYVVFDRLLGLNLPAGILNFLI